MTCAGAKGFGQGICVFPEPGELRVFHADVCPHGWSESPLTKGYVLVGRPDGASSGGNNGEPVLAKAEKGRVGPHEHAVTDNGHSHGITDPGHAHSMSWDKRAETTNRGGTQHALWNSGDSASSTNAASTGIAVNAASTGISVAAVTGNHYPLAYVLMCQKD